MLSIGCPMVCEKSPDERLFHVQYSNKDRISDSFGGALQRHWFLKPRVPKREPPKIRTGPCRVRA